MQTEESQLISEMVMSLMGVDRLAYIKPIHEGDEKAYAAYAADGTQLAVFDSIEDACHTVRRYKLCPVPIH